MSRHRASKLLFAATSQWLGPIETTFQEVRAHLGFQTTRPQVANSVLRTGPCLLGLFSLISLVFVQYARHHPIRLRRTGWYAKSQPTFSDAIATVRRLLWSETILQTSSHHDAFEKLPRQLRRNLLDRLSLAA